MFFILSKIRNEESYNKRYLYGKFMTFLTTVFQSVFYDALFLVESGNISTVINLIFIYNKTYFII